ncbi:arabinose isomerase [Ekhidna sp.]
MKTNIGLFAIGLDTYWLQFDSLLDRLLGYHKQISERISKEANVTDVGMVDSSERVKKAIEAFDSKKIDLLIVNISTYGLSQNILPIVRDSRAPTLILNLQPTASIDYDFINGLGDRGKMTGEWLAYCQACVAPEVGGVFSKANLPIRLVSGHLEDPEVWTDISEWIQAAKTVKTLKQNRVGILGHYYNGMLDVYSDLARYSAVLGSEFQILEFGELKALSEKISKEEINKKREEFQSAFNISNECSNYELERAATTSIALDNLVNGYNLDSLAYYYEGKGDPAYENIVTSLIPGFTLLTGNHIPVAGEYEIKNVHAMKIMDALNAGGSFAEFYAMDFNDDVILLGHDGPAHFAIAEGKVGLVPVPVYHGKPGNGLSIQMEVSHGAVTILSVCESGDGKLFLLCAEGRSVEGPTLQIGNTNSRYKFELKPKDFINQWSKAGPSHHMAIGVGHVAGQIEKLADLLGIAFIKIC